MSGNLSAREEENLTRAKKIRQNITKDNMRMAVRVAAGIILSVVLAQLIGLAFAASTCIVTLLGIQATKRETLQTAGMRIVSIAYTMVIAVAIDKIMGVNINSFMVAVVILTFLTYVIGWNGTLSINVVVLVHRSEERRGGKECRSRWSPDHEKISLCVFKRNPSYPFYRG